MKETIQTDLELIPPEGDPNVGYRVFAILTEIIQDKEASGLIEKWNRAAELTRNKHWKQKSGKPGLVTANLLFAHRQRNVNMLTDNNPTFNVTRMGEKDENNEETEVSVKMLRLAEFWWNDQEQQSVLEKSVGNGEEAGACVEKAVFNPDDGLLGEIEIQNIPLFNFGVYPITCVENKKAEANLHYYPMSLRAAKRKWPEHADKIVADQDILKEIGDNRREIGDYSSSKNTSYLSTFVNAVKNIINSTDSSEEKSDEVLIVEAWVRDYTEVPIGEPIKNEDGSTSQAYEPKYTGNIRRIQCCNAGRVVLDDSDNPSINPNIPKDLIVNSYLYDKFPFNIAASITNTASIWGMSDYEQLEQLNIEVDKTVSQLTVMKDKASRLKIINPLDSGVPNTHFTNKPGIINPTTAMVAQGIRYMDPPPIPAELITTLDVYKDLFFSVSGSFDLEQANSQGRDVIAYKAIAVLIERASTMMKGKIRNYSKLIRERGRMFISLAQNWYTEERWITYEDDGEEETMPIIGTELLFPAKISVVSGSTMPRAQVQEREEAIVLFDKGVLPPDELLKRLSWPNRKNVIKKLNEGPLGAFLEKLGAMGTPPEMVEMLSLVAQMDDKEFERALSKGEIPDIGQIIRAIATGEQPPNPEMIKQNIEAAKAQAEIKLMRAKAETERVTQLAAIAGIEFDAENVKQNWIKIQAMIEDQDFKNIINGIKAHTETSQYNEKGMLSNNKKLLS